MAENHLLLHPLVLTSSSTTTETSTSPEDAATVPPPLDHHKTISSNYGIILRFSLVIFIGIVSIWANREASKGFAITIVNETGDKRFQLFYVSNDEAARMIIRASKYVEKFFYHEGDDIHAKKQVKHVTLNFASPNFTGYINFDVDSVTEKEFVISINPLVMKSTNFSHVMSQIVQHAMVRIWIWDGEGKAPKSLIDGIVEYVTSKLRYPQLMSEPWEPGFMCNWKHGDPSAVANLLDYCERRRPGFVRRLNQGMKEEWHDGKLEMALGLPIQNLCASNGSGQGTTFTA